MNIPARTGHQGGQGGHMCIYIHIMCPPTLLADRQADCPLEARPFVAKSSRADTFADTFWGGHFFCSWPRGGKTALGGHFSKSVRYEIKKCPPYMADTEKGVTHEV